MPRLERGLRSVKFSRLVTKATALAMPVVVMLVVAGLAGASGGGQVTQVNCVNETGSGGCADGMSLLNPHGATFSGTPAR